MLERRVDTADFGRFRAANRFDALDGLRALSVIAVVWHHTSGSTGGTLAARGYLGVDFFFAISGFLITTLLLREFDSTRRISLRKFYARRALRIFPLYYATLLVYVALVAATRRHDADGREFVEHLPAFLTYTSNWFVDLGHANSVIFYFAWSLATEEQFYLLWPPLLVAALTLGRRRIWLPLAVLVVLVTISQGTGLIADATALPGRIAASMSLPILLASALALIVGTPTGYAVVANVLARIWSAPLAAVALIVAVALDAPQPATQCLMVAVVVSTCLVGWTPLHPALRWRPLAFVGVISYGVYLLHMLSANVARRALHLDHGRLLFAATLLLVTLAAYLSFRYFESPLLRLKRRFETGAQRGGDELSRIAAGPAAH
ncbi:acyltransferase [Candidatus Mycobacterium wuenschmannii]|uniref:Acyltransferase n=1 Tax=Candidatus Mycobacterium wuenschmannii TaxID=3027808 RepID=A0ABY8VQ42_9MYCO|nr:acyltransferase [Candidatus Mycobacterium wuenschmannii]WIM85743.1 acyltransferase [Candidatus Mycobacterium wuenschmannii]